MVFRRRKKRSVFGHARELLWPAAGYRRAALYLWLRTARLRDNPHSIAVGFACGAFISFTPFMGFHILLGGLAAWAMRGNIIAAAIGTVIGNPITFPFIWLWVYNLGRFVLGQEAAAEVPLAVNSSLLAQGGEFFWHIIVPMTIGGVPSGIVAGFVCYWPVRFMVYEYQKVRHERIARRARLRRKSERMPALGDAAAGGEEVS